MTNAQRFVDALLRIHKAAQVWQQESSALEERRWRQELREAKDELERGEFKDWEARLDAETREQTLCELVENRSQTCTRAYLDLMVAFGLAQLGASTESIRLQGLATAELECQDPVHRSALAGFVFRIDQARAGNPCSGALPAESLEILTQRDSEDFNARRDRYVFERIRGASLILEPGERVDAYRDWRRAKDRVGRAVAVLYEFTDEKTLEQRIRRLMAKFSKPDAQLAVLAAGLDLLPRLPPSFARALIDRLHGVLANMSPVRDLRELEKARKQSHTELSDQKASKRAFAAHHRQFKEIDDAHQRVAILGGAARRAADCADAILLRKVVACLAQMLDAQAGEDLFHALPVLANECLVGLRRLGLSSDLEALADKVDAWIHCSGDPTWVRRKPEPDWCHNQGLLLNAAASWLYLKQADQALARIDEVRSVLFDTRLDWRPFARTTLAAQYIAAVLHLPVDAALERLEELLPRMGPLGDTFTTNTHYSLVRLRLIDSIVRAVVHLASPDREVTDYLAVSVN